MLDDVNDAHEYEIATCNWIIVAASAKANMQTGNTRASTTVARIGMIIFSVLVVFGRVCGNKGGEEQY